MISANQSRVNLSAFFLQHQQLLFRRKEGNQEQEISDPFDGTGKYNAITDVLVEVGHKPGQSSGKLEKEIPCSNGNTAIFLGKAPVFANWHMLNDGDMTGTPDHWSGCWKTPILITI